MLLLTILLFGLTKYHPYPRDPASHPYILRFHPALVGCMKVMLGHGGGGGQEETHSAVFCDMHVFITHL